MGVGGTSFLRARREQKAEERGIGPFPPDSLLELGHLISPALGLGFTLLAPPVLRPSDVD